MTITIRPETEADAAAIATAFQVVRLNAYEEWMTGTLVFWALDSVGLRTDS